MKKTLIFLLCIFSVIFFTSCNSTNQESSAPEALPKDTISYTKITPEEAKNIMDNEDNIIILDVRTQEEFDSAHIEGAILLPYDQISEKASEILPDKNQTILVYCRSGNRSKTASETLVSMEYTKVYDFGGIIDWPY